MNLTTLLAIAGLVATIVVLITGVRSMMHGGEADLRRSARLMMARVEFQAATVLLVLLALYLGLR